MADTTTADESTPTGGSRMRLVLAVVLVLLVLLLIALGAFFVRVLSPTGVFGFGDAALGDLVWIRSMYGFGPAADQQLLAPTSVAIAPDGQVYVTDPQRSRIMIFNSGGSFARLLHTGAGGYDKGQFIRPEHIDIDERGDVYIADSFAQKVIVFDQNDKYLREWKAPGASGVTVRDTHVYVLARNHVYDFDKQGTKLGEFGKKGPRPGDIDAYSGIVADEKSVYIADSLNSRIQRFSRANADLLWAQPSSKGAPIQTIEQGTHGTESAETSADAPYDLPQDITVDGKGRLVVVDAFAFKLFVVDPETGKISANYADAGQDDGLFFYPTGIDYDPARDWFAVADTRNNRVQIVRIPDSGGGVQATARRALTSPLRYCAIPFVLLLLALILVLLSTRRTLAEEDDAEAGIAPEES